MNKTRLSLLHPGSCLCIIGFGLLFAPNQTLEIPQSSRGYKYVFPRIAGMLMSGLWITVFGIIRARVVELHAATLFIRIYFLACIAVFCSMNGDPLFLVMCGIVGLGFMLALTSCLHDRKSPVRLSALRAGPVALAESPVAIFNPVQEMVDLCFCIIHSRAFAGRTQTTDDHHSWILNYYLFGHMSRILFG
jgi:hypothetical protein